MKIIIAPSLLALSAAKPVSSGLAGSYKSELRGIKIDLRGLENGRQTSKTKAKIKKKRARLAYISKRLGIKVKPKSKTTASKKPRVPKTKLSKDPVVNTAKHVAEDTGLKLTKSRDGELRLRGKNLVHIGDAVKMLEAQGWSKKSSSEYSSKNPDFMYGSTRVSLVNSNGASIQLHDPESKSYLTVKINNAGTYDPNSDLEKSRIAQRQTRAQDKKNRITERLSEIKQEKIRRKTTNKLLKSSGVNIKEIDNLHSTLSESLPRDFDRDEDYNNIEAVAVHLKELSMTGWKYPEEIIRENLSLIDKSKVSSLVSRLKASNAPKVVQSNFSKFAQEVLKLKKIFK